MQTIHFNVFFKKQFINDFLLIRTALSDNFIISNSDIEIEKMNMYNPVPRKRYKIKMDGYLCSLFYYTLQTSIPFVNLLTKRLTYCYSECDNFEIYYVKVKLVPPNKELIDYKGNEMCEVLCLERRELDSAMAWFSTLGGAFSALGDGFEKCAVMAGKISIQQFQIAWRLGDPFLMARCKLYLSLSLIQRYYFKRAKQIIKEQYLFAVSSSIQDQRLISMCKGIWTKLQYDKSQYKFKKKSKIVY